MTTNFKTTTAKIDYTINGNKAACTHTFSADTLNKAAYLCNTADFSKALNYAAYFICIGEDDDGTIDNIAIL